MSVLVEPVARIVVDEVVEEAGMRVDGGNQRDEEQRAGRCQVHYIEESCGRKEAGFSIGSCSLVGVST